MATLVLLRYNNYYNRIVKNETTLSAYRRFQLGTDIEGVNFIPNDYIDTTQVINWDKGDPDYLLVLNDNNAINSKWFVISTERIREGQLLLTLHRDLVAEYEDDVLNADCFIEKGNISNINDPAIYNNEDMSFNQIKVDEIPLTDLSGCPWVVGYIPSDAFPTDKEISGEYPMADEPDFEVANLTDWAYNSYLDKTYTWTGPEYLTLDTGDYYRSGGKYYRCSLRFNIYQGIGDNVSFTTGQNDIPDSNYYYLWSTDSGINDKVNLSANSTAVKNAWASWTEKLGTQNLTQLKSAASSFVASIRGHEVLPADAPSLNYLNNKILHITNGDLYYRIHVTQTSFNYSSLNVPTGNTLRDTYLASIFQHPADNPIYGNDPGTEPVTINGIKVWLYDYNANAWKLQAYGYDYVISLEQLQQNVNTTIGGVNNRYHLSDSPYDMFCLPYVDGKTIRAGSSTLVSSTSKFAALFIAQQIAAQSGSGNVYDVQLLPYCPVRQVLKSDGSIDVAGTKYSVIRTTTADETTPVSILLWANKSTFSFDIPVNLPEESNPLNKKVKNLTQFYRLCSPNYSGMFDFNPQKNNGCTKINVDCTYKPFSPYIHLNPDFGGLYGDDYNDARGLICGGDFSVAQTTSAWANYQLNNKNYQQMFDRGIQNMEVNNAVQREKEQWQMAANVMGAFAQGKSAGDSSLFGLGGLMGIGNVQGAAQAGLSYMAGKRDIELNNQLRYEALDYSKDMFGYQLDNIRAIPQSIAKTSANTANNKLIPFLEKYDCDIVGTNYQRQTLIDKLKYNGMTIMRIGHLGSYITPWSYIDDSGKTINQKTVYIKGKLIRMPGDFQEDFHIVNAIARELNQGVFI